MMAQQAPVGFAPDAAPSSSVPAGFVPDPLPDFSATNEKGPEGSALVRGAMEFYSKSPLAPAMAAAKGTANVIAHPLDTYFGALPLAETVKDAAKAQWNQAVIAAQKAKDAYMHSDPLSASEAVGHGLAAVLPLIGPAAADVGEHFARGDVAGGVGGTLGLLAPFALKYGLQLKNAANPAKADLLQRDAEQQVSQQVLAPGNPKYKGVAAKIAPEVLSRHLKGSRLQLQQLADEGMADAGARIDAAVAAHSGNMPTRAVVQALDDRINEFKVHGEVIPTAAGRVEALQGLRDYLAKVGQKSGKGGPFAQGISFEDLRAIRDEFYDTADKAKGYMMAGGNEHIADVGWAAREAGGAIRQVVSEQIPGLNAPNADYTFYKRLSDVLDPTIGRPKATNYVPTGVTGGMATTGAIIGNAISDVPGLRAVGALIGSQILPRLKAAFASPEWQLASAAKKMELADALRSGSVPRIQGALLRVAEMAPKDLSATSLPVAASSDTPNQGR